MSKEYPSYNVYKGLQKPLIFKGFKGKFIYIGGACIISALLLCAIVSTLASFMWGGITLVIVMFGGLGITSQLQRKGLHRKDKRKGIYIVSRTFIRDRKKIKLMKKKSEFEAPYIGIETIDNTPIFYNRRGDYSVIIKCENPIIQYSADMDAYYDFHHLFSNNATIKKRCFNIVDSLTNIIKTSKNYIIMCIYKHLPFSGNIRLHSFYVFYT